MIFSNRDSGKSNIFGDAFDKYDASSAVPSDDVLESMRRKAWSSSPSGGEALRNTISRSSAATDDSSASGRAFIGMNSARSIFSDSTNNEGKIDAKSASDSSRQSEKNARKDLERKRRAESNPSGELEAKNFSAHASEHKRMDVTKNAISIFDKNPFERMGSNEAELKKNIKVANEDLHGSRQLTSKDVTERIFNGFGAEVKKATHHQSVVDNLINKLKGDKSE